MPQYADGFVIPNPGTRSLDQLRTELADLACELERQGRLDAADIVMQIDGRVRELSDDTATNAVDTIPPP